MASEQHFPSDRRHPALGGVPAARLYPELPWSVELELRRAAEMHVVPEWPAEAAVAPDAAMSAPAHPLHGPAPSMSAAAPAAGVVARLYPDLPWSVELALRQDEIRQAPTLDIPWHGAAPVAVELPSTPPARLRPWVEPEHGAGAGRERPAAQPAGRFIA